MLCLYAFYIRSRFLENKSTPSQFRQWMDEQLYALYVQVQEIKVFQIWKYCVSVYIDFDSSDNRSSFLGQVYTVAVFAVNGWTTSCTVRSSTKSTSVSISGFSLYIFTAHNTFDIGLYQLHMRYVDVEVFLYMEVLLFVLLGGGTTHYIRYRSLEEWSRY